MCACVCVCCLSGPYRTPGRLGTSRMSRQCLECAWTKRDAPRRPRRRFGGSAWWWHGRAIPSSTPSVARTQSTARGTANCPRGGTRGFQTAGKERPLHQRRAPLSEVGFGIFVGAPSPGPLHQRRAPLSEVGFGIFVEDGVHRGPMGQRVQEQDLQPGVAQHGHQGSSPCTNAGLAMLLGHGWGLQLQRRGRSNWHQKLPTSRPRLHHGIR